MLFWMWLNQLFIFCVFQYFLVLINNINICSRRWVETGDPGYGVAMKGYVKEVEELKTFIKSEEKRLGYYKQYDSVTKRCMDKEVLF